MIFIQQLSKSLTCLKKDPDHIQTNKNPILNVYSFETVSEKIPKGVSFELFKDKITNLQ